jgi:hypothetical protein
METIVLSSSAINTYHQCKKQYDLAYIKLLEPKRDEENPMSKGTDFHKWAEYQTRLRHAHLAPDPDYVVPEASEDTKAVYEAWWKNVGVYKDDNKKRILGVEQPIYTPIDVSFQDTQVFLRCTFDEIYLDNEGWIVGMDYKTFQRFEPWDVELDFQGRLYTAVLKRMFPDYKVRFEYERIRQTAPGAPRGNPETLKFEDGEWWQYNTKGDKRKRAEMWGLDDCYETIDMVCSEQEIETLWNETVYTVAELLVTQRIGTFYRQTSKMGCKFCYYKDLCKADLQGTLDEGTIELLANKRKPLEIPDIIGTMGSY